MRINQGQEFVLGGYTPTANNFDALIFGYYDGNRLIYVGRTRNGFTPVIRAQPFKRFRALESELWEKRISTFFANHLRREIWATPSAVAREKSRDWFFHGRDWRENNCK